MAALLFPLFQWLPTFGWPSRIRTDISTRHSVALLPWGICALILSANPVFPSVRCLSISHPSAQCTFGIIILRLPCSGGRIRTADLRVMGPASWPLLYPAVSPAVPPRLVRRKALAGVGLHPEVRCRCFLAAASHADKGHDGLEASGRYGFPLYLFLPQDRPWRDWEPTFKT